MKRQTTTWLKRSASLFFSALPLVLIGATLVIEGLSVSASHESFSKVAGTFSSQVQVRQSSQDELDGPDIIRARIRDYLRRHGIDKGFDPNQRLQLLRQEYEKRETEKAKRSLHPEVAGTNWVSLGPTNGAGRMTAVAVHSTISGTVYVGAAGGGVWKTTNGGVSWVCLTDSLNDLSVGAMAIAPSSPDIIYVGTGEGNSNGDAIPGIGLLKSTDGGQTWLFPPSVIATNFCKISVHPTNPQELVIGTNIGGFRSIDGGQNWTSVISGSKVTDILRHPTNPQILYSTAQFPSQVLKSVDGGATWVSKSSGVPLESVDRMSIAMSASSPLVLFVATSIFDSGSQDTISHIYKTNNGGESWSDLPGVSGNTSYSVQHFFGGQVWYDNTIVVSPSNSNVVIAGGVFYVRSTDGGATWAEAFSNGYPHVDAHDLQYQGPTLYIANDGGIWSSADNAQSSTDRNAGLVTRQYYTAANDPINRNRVYGGTQDNGTDRRPDSGGTIWTDILGGDGFDCAVNPYAPEMLYSTIQYGDIHRTNNAGTTGFFFNRISPDYPSGEGASFYTVLTIDPNNPSVLYTGSYRVWKSTDGGDTWSPLPTTTTDGSFWPPGFSSPLIKIVAARGDSRILMVSNFASVFRSTDGGTTWIRASGLPSSDSLEIDPQNPNIAYAAQVFQGFDHVYMTTDRGASWVPRGAGLPAFSAHVVRVDPMDSNVLFCGTDVGVYKSTDQGLNWTSFGTGLPSVSVYDLRILEDGSALRAATHGRGMWELQVTPSGNHLPTATITNPSTNSTVVRRASINFQGTVSDSDSGDSASGTWFFGDTGEVIGFGTSSSSVAHVFNRAGVFFASLTARDTHGALGNASRTITVTETFDSCATPMVIPGNGPFPWSLTANKDGATLEASDSQTPCSGNSISHTLWFEFTPAVSDTYKFSTSSKNYIDVVSLWTGPRCGPHTAVPNGCARETLEQPATVFATAGVTLHIMVSSLFDFDLGSVALIVTNSTADSTLRIDSVSPLAGRVSGGRQIKLTGEFAGLSSVTVGGVGATWNYTNGTANVAVMTPPHAVGAVAISLVRASGGTYTKSNAFAYLPTVFTDNTLVVQVTTAKAQHIIELRQAVDALRAVAGLGLATWTDSSLSPFSTTVKAVHILELRSFLEDAAGRLGYPAGSYTDPALSSGFLIKRIHIEELRQRVRNIAG